jgi:hypothetical protein
LLAIVEGREERKEPQDAEKDKRLFDKLFPKDNQNS